MNIKNNFKLINKSKVINKIVFIIYLDLLLYI